MGLLQQFGLDSSKFSDNGDNTISYTSSPGYSGGAGANPLKIPASYFSGGMYQQDMSKYGQIYGPGGMFVHSGDGQQMLPLGQLFSPQYSADGGAIPQQTFMGYDSVGNQINTDFSTPENSQYLASAQTAYNSLVNGTSSTTDFSNFGQPPQQLGTDVLNSLFQGGIWMPPGTDVNKDSDFLQANRLDDGSIMVSDPRGGAGANPNYYYDSSGKFVKTATGSKIMSIPQGLASVAASALGFGALGAGATGAAAGAAESGSGAGVTGLSSGADLDAAFGGLDTGAGGVSGLGASAAGGSSTGGGTSLGNLFNSGSSPLSRGLSSLSNLFGGGAGSSSSNGGNMDTANPGLGAFLPLLSGGLSAITQNNASNSMLDWLNQQQSNINNLYSPGSPEFNSLQDQLARKDAASGRNSQYGPRAVDLAGRITQIKADDTAKLAQGLAPSMSSAINQGANSLSGLTGALGNLGTNGGLNSLLQALGMSGGGLGAGINNASDPRLASLIANSGGNGSLGFQPFATSGNASSAFGDLSDLDISDWFM